MSYSGHTPALVPSRAAPAPPPSAAAYRHPPTSQSQSNSRQISRPYPSEQSSYNHSQTSQNQQQPLPPAPTFGPDGTLRIRQTWVSIREDSSSSAANILSWLDRSKRMLILYNDHLDVCKSEVCQGLLFFIRCSLILAVPSVCLTRVSRLSMAFCHRLRIRPTPSRSIK